MSERRLEQLDLNLVLTLHWVLTEQSVSRAAERLGVSQPAVSHGLKRLREAFGDPLLVKSGKVMRTTPRAERLKPEVAVLVNGLRDLFQTEALFDPATATGRFCVSAPDDWAVLAARAWKLAVSPEAPALTLDLVAIDFPVAQDLISGAVDLALLPETKVLNLPPGLDIEQFVQRPVYENPYLVGVPETSPLHGEPLTLEAYAGADHVMVHPHGTVLEVIDDVLADVGLKRRIAYRTETFLGGVAIAEATGSLITVARSSFVAASPRLSVVPPPLPVSGYTMLSGWHPNWTGDPRHRWLREKLTEGLTAVLAEGP